MNKNLVFASGSLLLLFSIYTVMLLSFLFKIPVSGWQFFVSLVFPFFYFVVLKNVKSFFAVLAVFLLCIYSTGLLIDTSYDGQAYQQGKVLALKNGWNPFYDNFVTNKQSLSENKSFIQAYPSANSIVVFSIFQITKNLETGKGLTLFLIIISFLFLIRIYSLFVTNKFLVYTLSLVTVLNPISLVQVFTFGLDSQFYSFLLILFSLGILIYKKEDLYFNFFNFFMTLVLLVNNKLTSIIYLGLFAVAAFIFVLVKKYKSDLYFVFQTAAIIVLFTGISVFAYGYQPFVTNYKLFNDPFYPIGEFDYSENRPINFRDENRLSLFFESLFFKTNGEFSGPKDKAEYKLPFTMSSEDGNAFTYLGPKSGGFGIFFSGLLLLVSILYLVSVSRNRYSGNYSFAILTLVSSCIANPLNNVARYIPQLWFVLPLTMLMSSTVSDRRVFIVNFLILCFVILNSFFIFKSAFVSNLTNTQTLKTGLHNLKVFSQREPLQVSFGQSEGNKFLLDRYSVRYTESKKTLATFTCQKKYKKMSLMGNVGNSVAQVCIR